MLLILVFETNKFSAICIQVWNNRKETPYKTEIIWLSAKIQILQMSWFYLDYLEKMFENNTLSDSEVMK